MEREDYINQILDSVYEIIQVTPSDIVFQRIEYQIADTKISPKTFWIVAASIVALLSLNIFLLNNVSNSSQSEMMSLRNTVNKSNQLYK